MTRAMWCLGMSHSSLLMHFKGITFFSFLEFLLSEQNVKNTVQTLICSRSMSQYLKAPIL